MAASSMAQDAPRRVIVGVDTHKDVHVARAKGTRVHAPARVDDDQSVALELADRLAHRDAANPERLGEARLEQALAWLDLASQDRLLEVVVDLLLEARVLLKVRDQVALRQVASRGGMKAVYRQAMP